MHIDCAGSTYAIAPFTGTAGGITTTVPTVTYQTYDSSAGRWFPNVTNNSDYAGVFGSEIDGIQVYLS